MLKLSSYSLLAFLFAVSVAHAAEGQAPEPTSSSKDYFVGIGQFGELLHVNFEHTTRWGNFQYRAGRFGQDENYGLNFSWRKPLKGEDAHATGFYLGAFAGQVLGEQVNGDSVQRLGGGAEMGYHWVNEYTRKELTVGLGTAEPVKEKNVELDAEPTLFVSFTIALGV